MLVPLFLLGALPAAAQEAPESLHFIGRYDFSWAGIGLAAAEFSIDEDKDSYALRLVIVSKGIVNLFTRHRSDTSTSGKRNGAHYMPRVYESHYWTKNKPRHIKLVFDPAGKIAEETVEPPEDRNERPEVPHALKDGALDPLTVALAVPTGNLTPRAFDAKHLYEGHAKKGELVTLRILDEARPAIPYRLTRTPLAGMTNKEMKQYREGEPPLTFYFSADARHIPLYINMPLYLYSLKGILIKECRTWDECRVN